MQSCSNLAEKLNEQLSQVFCHQRRLFKLLNFSKAINSSSRNHSNPCQVQGNSNRIFTVREILLGPGMPEFEYMDPNVCHLSVSGRQGPRHLLVIKRPILLILVRNSIAWLWCASGNIHM